MEVKIMYSPDWTNIAGTPLLIKVEDAHHKNSFLISLVEVDYNDEEKPWNAEDIKALLRDGMKFRELQRARQIEEDMRRQHADNSSQDS